jgi:hypothetical protein
MRTEGGQKGDRMRREGRENEVSKLGETRGILGVYTRDECVPLPRCVCYGGERCSGESLERRLEFGVMLRAPRLGVPRAHARCGVRSSVRPW